jgi:hypothetical protein
VDLRQVRLRASPRFRLVPFDGLPSAQQNALRSLSEDPEFFGVLTPSPDSGLSTQSVSRDAALLFLALAEPACLPTLLTRLLGDAANERLRALVLDQVFEVEHEGRFVSGPAALQLLGGETPSGTARIAALSSQAIAYARALESVSMNEIAARLYGFNAAPSTPALQRRFASDDSVRLFLCARGDTERRVRSRWQAEATDDNWLMWSGSSADGGDYKLYVSPVLDELPRVFEAVVHALARVDCPRFKVGRGAYGLLRPDKLVAYFPSLERLQHAGELIANGAGDAAAQGVPFSAPIDAAGLLSWGMDPPRFDLVPEGQAVLSWRAWLSHRIAASVVAARQSGEEELQAFVRRRIALDGVDPLNWTPDPAMWRRPVAALWRAT